jgi:hypothetical protein
MVGHMMEHRTGIAEQIAERLKPRCRTHRCPADLSAHRIGGAEVVPGKTTLIVAKRSLVSEVSGSIERETRGALQFGQK